MQKYLLTALYLLVMYALFKHPISLPNEGKAIPIWDDEKPIQDGNEYAIELKTQKTAFQIKDDEILKGRNIRSPKDKKQTY